MTLFINEIGMCKTHLDQYFKLFGGYSNYLNPISFFCVFVFY